MITEAMRRAGWRECPSDEVRKAWEEKGGRWQIFLSDLGGYSCVEVLRHEEIFIPQDLAARPVHPSTWDYDARGWSEDLTPTEPGWYWWRRGEGWNWRVLHVTARHDGRLLSGTCLVANIKGEWGGSIPMPRGG